MESQGGGRAVMPEAAFLHEGKRRTIYNEYGNEKSGYDVAERESGDDFAGRLLEE